MKIAMIGAGYVGLVSGACFAEFGVDVTIVDTEASKIEALQADLVQLKSDTGTSDVSVGMPLAGYQAIPAGVSLTHRMHLMNSDAVELGLLLAGLAQWSMSPVLGAHHSTGCGMISGQWDVFTPTPTGKVSLGTVLLTPFEGLQVTGEALLAAQAEGIPSIIHEQNAVLGRVNRTLASRVNAIATSCRDVDRLAGKLHGKVTLVGNPVRAEVLALPAEAARAAQRALRRPARGVVRRGGGPRAAPVPPYAGPRPARCRPAPRRGPPAPPGPAGR